MPATLTVTGKAGPNQAVTTSVFTGVSSFNINCDTNMLTFLQSSRTVEVAITSATTIIATKSGSTYTLTIS